MIRNFLESILLHQQIALGSHTVYVPPIMSLFVLVLHPERALLSICIGLYVLQIQALEQMPPLPGSLSRVVGAKIIFAI